VGRFSVGYNLALMPEFTIRDAVATDADRLIALILELARYEKLEHIFVNSADELRRWLFSDSPVAGCFVAERDSEIVGYAIYFRSFSTFLGKPGFWLEDLYVTPAMRGTGIGKSLLKKLARTAVEAGHARVEWAVLEWNQPAIDFYQSIGANLMPDWRLCRLTDDNLRSFAD
jgi:GNAT superfamily N-acetyltransferase